MNFWLDTIEWFIEYQAFSSSYDLAPRTTPLSPLVSSIGNTQEDWERETTCWPGGGGGEQGAK
jgi:hypothetical protein